MSQAPTPSPGAAEGAGGQSSKWGGTLRRTENVVLAAALGAMCLLPLAESFLRQFFHVGISGATAMVQHLVLIAGMLGSAVAAREGRLLCLSTAATYLRGRWKSAATLYSNSVGVAVSVFLFLASLRFVLNKREAGETFVYGVPLWSILLILPLGFGLVALRMWWSAAGGWRGRWLALGLIGLLVAAGAQRVIPAEKLVVPALLVLLAATALGAPVFATLGGAALILFWGKDEPIAMVSIDHYRLAVDPTLPTIPLFTLAGYFLAEGGASRRLVRVFQALLGQFRGGPAIVATLVCALFTMFTGASGVTILALGGLLLPVLLAAGYKERDALGLLTSAGSLGLLFPPCLPLILYAVVATAVGAEVTMMKIFLGGVLPGVLLVVLTTWWGVRQGPKVAADAGSFNLGEAGRAIAAAKWELLMPVVALVSLFGGFATPVEAAAVTALYAFVVECFVYRDLKLGKDVARVMTDCGLLVGGVLLILGVAMGFTDYLFDARVPETAVTWATGAIQHRWVFLLALNLFLLIVGCLMDIFSAIVVVAPLIIPLGRVFGVDPVHLGIIFLTNLELGYLTPPVGMNLFLSSYRFNKPMGEIVRAVLPLAGLRVVAVLLITYVPALATWLPRLVK